MLSPWAFHEEVVAAAVDLEHVSPCIFGKSRVILTKCREQPDCTPPKVTRFQKLRCNSP